MREPRDLRVFGKPGVYTFTVKEEGPAVIVLKAGSEDSDGYVMIDAPAGTFTDD
jgi:hypothetical protein